MKRDGRDVLPVNLDAAPTRIYRTEQAQSQSTLPRARRANEADSHARLHTGKPRWQRTYWPLVRATHFDRTCHAVKNLWQIRGITHSEVLELDTALTWPLWRRHHALCRFPSVHGDVFDPLAGESGVEVLRDAHIG